MGRKTTSGGVVDVLAIIEEVERGGGPTRTRDHFTLSNQRLRSLTTGLVHTDMNDIMDDLRKILGSRVTVPTIGAAIGSVRPWLQAQGLDKRFWVERRDTAHTGKTQLPVPTAAERAEMKKHMAGATRRG
jgi:hypothetical protein